MADGASEFPSLNHPEEPILRYFAWAHLPAALQDVSRPFGELALYLLDNIARSPERTVALRKLLEGKDAAVRAALPPAPAYPLVPKVAGRVEFPASFPEGDVRRIEEELSRHLPAGYRVEVDRTPIAPKSIELDVMTADGRVVGGFDQGPRLGVVPSYDEFGPAGLANPSRTTQE